MGQWDAARPIKDTFSVQRERVEGKTVRIENLVEEDRGKEIEEEMPERQGENCLV